MEKLQELFTDRVNNTLWATKKHFYDKFEVEQNLNRLDMLKQFVQFLVENDKIKPLWKFIGWETDEDEPYIQFDLVDQYIAYLSIQDNPIEFLVSILK